MMFNTNERLVLKDPITGELHDFALTKVGLILATKWVASTIEVSYDKVIEKNESYKSYISRKNVRIISNNAFTKDDLIKANDLTDSFFEASKVETIISGFSQIKDFYDLHINSSIKEFFVEKCKKENNDFVERIFYGFDISDYIPRDIYAQCYCKNGCKFYANKNDTFCINGYCTLTLIHNELKRYIKTCEDCGNKFLDMNDGNIPISIRGINGYCSNCAINYHSYFECEGCGELHDNDERNYVENDETFICDECAIGNGYYRCERCGNLINTHNDYYHIWTEDDRFYCCEDCAQRDGYHYSDGRDAWIDYDADEDYENENILADYHSTTFAKLGLKPKNAVQWLGSGSEIEVDGDEPYEKESFWRNDIYDGFLQGGKYGALEHDGSVTAEIVMQPMTEKEFDKFDFEGMFKALVEKGYTGHDNNDCGSHVHLSKGYLGYNNNQIINNAKKVCAFFENNWNDLVKFSRREASQLHWCDKFGFKITKDTDFNELTDSRYHAVNLTNLFTYERGTIEIRIPRGTLNPKTFRATTDFLRHIVRNAKNISWKNINNLKLWFKGIKNPNTIEYLKSKKCFMGEF